MSYILDALRKAEAERERGTVPGIHAQPAFAGARPAGAPAKSRMWIVAPVAALIALLVAIVFYLLLGRGPANEVAQPGLTPSAPVAVAVAPAISVAPTPAPAPVATVAPVQTAAPSVRKPVRPASAPALAAAPPAVAASLPATPKADDRIYAIDELPDDIRRQLPALSVGGSMYSPTPASRLVIINGQVLHEGERITPDLLVQQIRLKSAVLAFKGYRYALSF